MKTQLSLPVYAAALALALAGCTTYQQARDTTQPSKLQKAAFADGPWYTLRTVIDAPYEAGFTFIGEAGEMQKIQWDIQQDYIYAYKTYEFIQGEDAAAKKAGGDNFRGEPVAAYKIDKHFDLWHDYNPITGEEGPVLSEATERPWYEREYFRVDWSANLVKSFNFMGSQICELEGAIQKSPITYTPNKPGDPQAVYFSERNADGTWINHYDLTKTQLLNKIDYIDVINREFAHVNLGAFLSPFSAASPGCAGSPYFPLAEDMQITYRQSFLKVDKERQKQAEPVYYPDPSFEKFGFFRDERLHYDASRGVTDFLGYQMHRWNIWQKTKDDAGKPIAPADREVKPIVYYINGDAPQSFQTIAASEIAGKSWNVAFQEALAANNWKGGADHKKVSDQAMFVIKPTDKDCGLDGNQECQQPGDLRYSFANDVTRPNMGSPLGYGPSFSDPETGEIINGTANFYGAALNTLRGYIEDIYDLEENPGAATETSILTGESVRKYFQGVGNVVPPTFPNVRFDPNLLGMPGTQGAATLDPAALTPTLFKIKNVLDTMKRDGPGSLYTMAALKGTPIENMMVEADGYLRLYGYNSVDEIDPAAKDQILDKVSPLRNKDYASAYERMNDFWSRGGTTSSRDGAPTSGCALPAETLFDDGSVLAIINEAKLALQQRGLDDVPGNGDEKSSPQKADVIDWILLHTYRGVEEHEVGHTFGLRHNFEGTADEENYQPEYWAIANNTETKLPTAGAYDANHDGTLQYNEWQTYLQDYSAAHAKQELAGVNFHEYSSIMDYSQHFYYNDVHGIGKYDHAAIKFGYANTIEAYNSPVVAPDKSNRVDVPYFLGGQSCNITSDCGGKPFNVNGKTFSQRCRGSVTKSGVEVNLGQGLALDSDADEASYQAQYNRSGGVCSDVYTELTGGEVVDSGGNPTGELFAVSFPNYMFCSDERVQDRPFCTRYDEGRNAVEVVQNQIAEYQRNYIFSNFRRYRYNFGMGYPARVFGRFFVPMGKIYQSMLYQYYYNPTFRESPDRGFTDFLQASVIALNFFGQVLAEPAIGQFQQLGDIQTPPDQPRDIHQEIVRWTGSELCSTTAMSAIQPCLGLGYGRYLWSSWEQGYYGIDRMARVGTFYDKLMALEALSTRDWGFPRFSDETYPISFYDGFKDELLQMFGGMATENLPAYASLAHVNDAGQVDKVQYRNFWTGKFFNTDAKAFGIEVGGLQFGCDDPKINNCTGVIQADFPSDLYNQGYRPADPGGSFILRLESLIFAVTGFSPYYDQTFPGYVQLSVFGQADPHDPKVTGDPTVDEYVKEGKMVEYASPKFNKIYTASKSSDGKSFTASMVQRASDLSSVRQNYLTAPVGQINADPRCTLNRLSNEDCRQELINWTDNDLNNTETLLNYTGFLLNALGVH